MQIHDKPGRGLKYCSSCKKYVGVRSRFCPNCGGPFKEAIARAQKKKHGKEIAYIPEKSNSPKTKYMRVLAPSGHCPVKIKEFDRDSVISWARNVQAHGFEQDQHYTATALRYYLREFLYPLSEEYQAAASYITDEEFS